MSDKTASGKYGTAFGRWAGFGPYYAMFPVEFARRVVNDFCPPRGRILDPFCGRGTAPFVAQASGRKSVGVDSNPVAWVFAKTKTEPAKCAYRVIQRAEEIQKMSRARDGEASNEFQKWAWHPRVLRFLKSARRNLNWRDDKVDRTLTGLILSALHSKLGDGVSNQMMKARALGPDYSVRWWKKRGMRPPDIAPVEFFQKCIEWRYRHGTVPRTAPATILLGDADGKLRGRHRNSFDLLFTSPPYLNVTSYLHDSWIRLWMLREGGALPDWRKDPKMHSAVAYRKMMENTFERAGRLLKPRANVWVRTDARQFTKETTRQVLMNIWGGKHLYFRTDIPAKRTQTAQYGNVSPKPGEIDFLVSWSPKKAAARGFRRVHS